MLKPLSRCPHADLQKEHDSLKYPPGEQALSKNGDERQCASNLSSIPGFARVVVVVVVVVSHIQRIGCCTAP